MSDNKEELNALIADLRGKLPADTTIELVEADEPQCEPWIIGSLDDLEAMVSRAAEAITQAVESGEMSEGAMSISALDESPESMEAMQALTQRIAPHRYYMQYLLDDNDDPYPAGDNMYDRWQASKLLSNHRRRIVKKTFMMHRGQPIEVSTVFLVFNHQYGDGPPILYETMVFSKIQAIDGVQCRYDCKNCAKQGHCEVVKVVRQVLATLPRPISPTRRAKAAKRIAAGRDVLRRKPTKESAERWFQRILYEAFGDADGPEIAQELGLPSMHRKRGQQ